MYVKVKLWQSPFVCIPSYVICKNFRVSRLPVVSAINITYF